MNKDAQNKKNFKMFCPVIKDYCVGKQCMFYLDILWLDLDKVDAEKNFFDCAYVHGFRGC